MADTEGSPSASPVPSVSSLGEGSSHPTSPSATSADLPPSPTAKTLSLSPSEREEEGKRLKDEGNKLFLAADFESAKVKYGESLAADPSSHIVWSNRAACELKLEQHGLAIEDASEYP
jgi:hypothetical protein